MATTFHKHLVCASLLLGAVVFTPSAFSADFENFRRASNQELGTMRGGFEVDVGGNKLILSLGIERITFINGELATVIPLSDPHFQLVQNGPNNNFTPASAAVAAATLPPGMITLIQNSLDNQVIRNLMLINATLAVKDIVRSQTISTSLSLSRANSQP